MAWCSLNGEPSDPANQKPLSSIRAFVQGFSKTSVRAVSLRLNFRALVITIAQKHIQRHI